MSGSRRDCFDWPQRPDCKAALSAEPAPAGAHTPAGATTGGEGPAPLLTLAAITLAPVMATYVIWALVEAMTRMPMTFLIIGAGMLFGGAIAYALTEPQPMRVQDDGIVIVSPLYDMRLKR